MKLKKIAENSAIISFSRRLPELYLAFKYDVAQAYRRSYMCRSSVAFIEKNDPSILDNSKFGRMILISYDKLQKRTIGYSNTSLTDSYLANTKRELGLYPLKIGGAILTSAVIISFILSFLLHRKLEVAGIAVRILLLLIGFCAFLCGVDLEAAKKDSILFKILSP